MTDYNFTNILNKYSSNLLNMTLKRDQIKERKMHTVKNNEIATPNTEII